MRKETVHKEFLELYLAMVRMQKHLSKQPEGDALATSHRNALMILLQSGAITMSGLAGKMGISRQQMTAIVDLLVERQLALRRVDPENRRLVMVELTGQGAQMARQVGHCLFDALPQDREGSKRLAEAIVVIKETIPLCAE